MPLSLYANPPIKLHTIKGKKNAEIIITIYQGQYAVLDVLSMCVCVLVSCIRMCYPTGYENMGIAEGCICVMEGWEGGGQPNVTMGTGKYRLPTFRASSHSSIHSQLFISPQATSFCLFLRPSFSTSLYCPSFWHIKALHKSDSFSVLLLTRPPLLQTSQCPFIISFSFSHLFFSTLSFFYFIIPVSLPHPHPSSISSSLFCSLLLAQCSKSSLYKKKQKTNPRTTSLVIDRWLQFGVQCPELLSAAAGK